MALLCACFFILREQALVNDNDIGADVAELSKSKESSEQILPNAKACVRQSLGNRHGNQCELYPCDVVGRPLAKPDKDSVENVAPFGYAGRSVLREDGVKRARMQVGGSASWDSGCVISHKYKFVYAHVLKSGGSALKTFIRRSFCGEEDPDCRKADKQIISPASCSTAISKHPDYFFWSFVRNPFSRMYSMYSMMEGFPVRGKSFADFPFDAFVLNPNERSQYTRMSSSHYVPQHKFLFDSNGCPSIDFFGRVEHFDEDLKVVLKHLNAPEMDAQLKSQGGTMLQENNWGTNGKKAKLGGDLRNAYHSQELVDRAADIYSEDFKLLGFDPDMSAVPLN